MKVQSDFALFDLAVTLFHVDHNRLPTTLEELINDRADAFSSGHQLDPAPTDPWTRAPYLFESTPTSVRFVSLGRDRKRGGVGPDADAILISDGQDRRP